MATLADLKTRIISETTRDDLSDDMASDLNTVIASAIDLFAAERWWFNEVRTTSTCVVGSTTQAIPSGTRFVDMLFLIVGNIRYPMCKRDVTTIDSLYSTPLSGQPTDWAVLGTNAYVWPTPNTAWSLLWETVADVTPAIDYSDGTSANAWTNYGADLIVAQSKIRLYRDYLSAVETDPRLQLAIGQAREAYARLKAETNRRLATGRIAPSW